MDWVGFSRYSDCFFAVGPHLAGELAAKGRQRGVRLLCQGTAMLTWRSRFSVTFIHLSTQQVLLQNKIILGRFSPNRYCFRIRYLSTQQVLLQNKIILTSVLWRLVFGRMLEYRQWFALILLNFGSTVTVLSEFPTSLDELKKVVTVSYAGLMLVLLYCFCSASAGVYCEWVYKRGASTPSSLKNPKNTRSPPAAAVSHSMHFANIGMYVGGLVVNYVGYIYSQVDRTSASQSAFASVVVGGVGGGDRTQAFFAGLAKAFAPVRWSISTRGWNVFTVLDCLNKMLLGLTLGFVMKHLTNIHKLFMFGASMFVSAMLVSGAPLLGLDLRSVWTPTPTSLAGMAAILVSLVLFNWTTIQKTRKEKARKIAEEVEMKQQ